jgi:hypothetical protein
MLKQLLQHTFDSVKAFRDCLVHHAALFINFPPPLWHNVGTQQTPTPEKETENMQQPEIRHELKDTENNILFIVMAYRQLSKSEILTAINYWTVRNKKPRPGSQIIIPTTIR